MASGRMSGERFSADGHQVSGPPPDPRMNPANLSPTWGIGVQDR